MPLILGMDKRYNLIFKRHPIRKCVSGAFYSLGVFLNILFWCCAEGFFKVSYKVTGVAKTASLCRFLFGFTRGEHSYCMAETAPHYIIINCASGIAFKGGHKGGASDSELPSELRCDNFLVIMSSDIGYCSSHIGGDFGLRVVTLYIGNKG